MPVQPGSRHRNYSVEPATNQFGPKHTDPHSDWQLLIERQREKKQLAIREVATRARIPAGTLFNWIRSRRGSPTVSRYTPEINNRLATSLGLKPETLAEAYNSSQPKFDEIKSAPAPRSVVAESPAAYGDRLARLLALLEASGQSTFTIDRIRRFAELL